ncbi:hypothetical protein J7E62_01665 [Variovorax paradoxus]|nr:hypothetical protein [Variovorax paradoxus]
MEPALILRTSTVLLVIAAVGGIVMAGFRFAGAGDRGSPAALAMLHGFLAAPAITLLLHAAATVGLTGMALIAAAGGGVILNSRWEQLPLPSWLIVVHAIVAVAGFILRVAATSTTWK